MSDLAHSGGLENSGPAPRRRFSRFPLYAALALVGFALLLTVFGRVTGIGTLRTQFGEPVAIRDISFEQRGQYVNVTDVRTGELIAELDNDGKGFIFGALRGLERVRLVKGIPRDHPYRIIEWENGWLSLSDTGTGERVYLEAFGPDNVAAMKRFLEAERSVQ